MYSIIKRAKLKILILVILSLFIAFLELISLSFIGELISILMNGYSENLYFSNVIDPIHLAVFLIAVRPIASLSLIKYKIDFINDVRCEYIQNILNLRKDKRIEFTNFGKINELVSALTVEIGIACTGFLQNLIAVLSDLILTCVLLGLTVYLISPSSSIFVFLLIVFSLLILRSVSRIARFYGSQRQEYEKRLLNHVNSYVVSSASVSDETKLRLTDSYFSESLRHIRKSYGLQQILLNIPKLVIDVALLLLVVSVFVYFTRFDPSFEGADNVLLIVIVALRLVPILGRSFTSLQGLNYTYPSFKFVHSVYEAALDRCSDFKERTQYNITTGENFALTFKFTAKNGKLIQHTICPNDGIVCITGPSGVGKSTLLKAVSGLNTINDYVVEISVPKQYKLPLRVELMMQNNKQFNYDGTDYIRLGDEDKFKEHFKFLLPDKNYNQFQDFLSVDDFHARYSGGEIERVSLISAISRSIDVLLIDEVGSGLDDKSKIKFLKTVRGLSNSIRLIVSHDEMIVSQADRTIYFE